MSSGTKRKTSGPSATAGEKTRAAKGGDKKRKTKAVVKKQAPDTTGASVRARPAAGTAGVDDTRGFTRAMELEMPKGLQFAMQQCNDWRELVLGESCTYANRVFPTLAAAAATAPNAVAAAAPNAVAAATAAGDAVLAVSALDDTVLAETLSALDGPVTPTMQPSLCFEGAGISTRMAAPKRLPALSDLAFLLCRTQGDPKLTQVYESVTRAAEEARTAATRPAQPLPPHTTAAQRACAAAALWTLAAVQRKQGSVSVPHLAYDCAAAILRPHHTSLGATQAAGVADWVAAWLRALPAARAFTWRDEWMSSGLAHLAAHLHTSRTNEAHARALAAGPHLVLPLRLVYKDWRVSLDLPYSLQQSAESFIPTRIGSHYFDQTGVAAQAWSAYAGDESPAATHRSIRLDPSPLTLTGVRLVALARELRAVAGRASTAAAATHDTLCGVRAPTTGQTEEEGHEEEVAATALVAADTALPVGPRSAECAAAGARALALLALRGGVSSDALMEAAADLEQWGSGVNPYRTLDFSNNRWKVNLPLSLDELTHQLRASPRPAQQPWLALHTVVTKIDLVARLASPALVLLVVDYAAAVWDEDALSSCVRLRPS